MEWILILCVLLLAIALWKHLNGTKSSYSIELLEFDVKSDGDPVGNHQTKLLSALCKLNGVFVKLVLEGYGRNQSLYDIKRNPQAGPAWQSSHPWLDENNLLVVRSAFFGENVEDMIECPNYSVEILKIVAFLQEHARNLADADSRDAFTKDRDLLAEQNRLLRLMRDPMATEVIGPGEKQEQEE